MLKKKNALTDSRERSCMEININRKPFCYCIPLKKAVGKTTNPQPKNKEALSGKANKPKGQL